MSANDKHKEVWQFVSGTGIAVNPTLVASYDDIVSDLLEKGLSPQDVSVHVVVAIRRHWKSFKAGMDVFEDLCECLRFVSREDGDGAVHPPEEVLAHIVKTKAELAVYYDELAWLAPFAAVEGLDADATARERMEAIAEREQVLERLERASEHGMHHSE